MKIALIFNTTRPDTTGGYLERACDALGVAHDHWSLSEAARIPPPPEYDLYLRVDHGDDYEVPLPKMLRPAVFYAIDTHLPHSFRKIRRTAGRYDLLLSCHLSGAERLPGAEWLPVACDPRVHAAPPQGAVWDVAFVGNDGGVPRKFILQALRERYPSSRIGRAPHTDLAHIYGRARVGFNFSIANDVNMRMFEVMAAGALLVTNALDNGEMEALGLEPGEHLVTYRRPEELFEVIDRYLADEPARTEIARAGSSLVLERHTYAHRLRRLLELAESRLGLANPLKNTVIRNAECGMRNLHGPQ
ncbi:MAG TPA: glycosyltransferase [bacterium]